MSKQHIAETTIVVAYPVTVEAITLQLSPLAALTAYPDVVKGIATCRGLRVLVEERRKFLKADSLAYGKTVDRVASELTATIEAYEKPLKALKAAEDDARAAAKAEKDRLAREALIAEERAKFEAEKEAEAARTAEATANRVIENKALEARRAEIARLKAEADAAAAAERAELVALRAQLEADRAQAAQDAARVAAERQQLAQEQEQARTRARLAAEAEENRLAAEAEAKALEAKRAAAEPDLAKLSVWAGALDVAQRAAPLCIDPDVAQLVADTCQALTDMARELRSFDGVSL